MKIETDTNQQYIFRSNDERMAFFMPYKGDNRCNKCMFCTDEKMCMVAPCLSVERKDGQTGFFRSANGEGAAEYNYTVETCQK